MSGFERYGSVGEFFFVESAVCYFTQDVSEHD